MFNYHKLSHVSRKTNSQRKEAWKTKNIELSKERHKLYNKNYRLKLKNTLSDEEKLSKQLHDRERQQLLRAKKKAENTAVETRLIRPQVLGKMLKNTRLALKGTPDQNVQVLRILSQYSLSQFIIEDSSQSPRTVKNTPKM